MSVRLPSRYEDLSETYRGRLDPNPELLQIVDRAHKSMRISGGIRFLPVFGDSGSGKSCAAREINTHLPQTRVFQLAREEIEDPKLLLLRINKEELEITDDELLIAVIDQFEEIVSEKEKVPTQFVETISILDRNQLKDRPVIFIWLTTRADFRNRLVQATTRNRRILLAEDFNITGPNKSDWPKIIRETFSFHNNESALADYNIIDLDLEEAGKRVDTIGSCIGKVSELLSDQVDSLQNLSEYRVVLVWPVADSLRNQRVLQFSRPREGYALNWDAWHSELNAQDRAQLPLREFNRARLYFDVRIIPVRAADLHKMFLDLDNELFEPGKTYLDRFEKTHLFHIVSGTWKEYDYSAVRERESKRSEEAKEWYSTVTNKPTQMGKRLAKVFTKLGLSSRHEEDVTTKYSSVRADVFVEKNDSNERKQIIELKVFSLENTMPSSIKDAIKTTLRRHAQLAGFLQRT